LTSTSRRAARDTLPGSPGKIGEDAGNTDGSAAQRAGPVREPNGTRICVARIGAAHGTRGEVRLWPFTAEPEAVRRYGPLEAADGTRLFEIEALRPARGCFVARFRGVADRSTAERLRNIDLYVPRDRLPAPQPDEFYHADLIGLDALDTAGTSLGTVIAVHNFGAGDLLEIASVDGRETLFMPFTAAAVPKIEIEAGCITIDPPAGLLEPESGDGGQMTSASQPEGRAGR
jgi:16S rRNA processing protein RimM